MKLGSPSQRHSVAGTCTSGRLTGTAEIFRVGSVLTVTCHRGMVNS